MSTAFQCPFCQTVSHNPNDARYRYCARCDIFVDDVLQADPLVRQDTVRMLRKQMEQDPSTAARALKQIEIWGHGLQ